MLLDITLYIALILAAAICILALIDAKYAPGPRRPFRLFQSAITFYFVVLYSFILLYDFGVSLPDDLVGYIRSGQLTRIGVIIIFTGTLHGLVQYAIERHHAARNH